MIAGIPFEAPSFAYPRTVLLGETPYRAGCGPELQRSHLTGVGTTSQLSQTQQYGADPGGCSFGIAATGAEA
jgi:hypothetical protein